MQTINGNIIEITHGIITHQVNCQGIMGTGIAKTLRAKFPSIYPRYREFCLAGQFRPGMIQMVKQSESLYVCNLAGQDKYGRDYCHTDYDALNVAFPKLAAAATKLQLPVYIPFNMGCANAGGNWDVVSELIERHLPNAIIVKLP